MLEEKLLARGLETLQLLYNPLTPTETNVKKRLREVLKHLNLNVTIWLLWHLAKKSYQHDGWKHFILHTTLLSLGSNDEIK